MHTHFHLTFFALSVCPEGVSLDVTARKVGILFCYGDTVTVLRSGVCFDTLHGPAWWERSKVLNVSGLRLQVIAGVPVDVA